MPSKVRNSLIFLGALLILVLPVLGERTVFRAGPNLFTVEQDVEMGRALAADAANSVEPSTDQASHGYINQVGKHVAHYAPGYKYPWEFRIFKDSAINSYALPGGVIYVSSGIVQAAPTEPQLAGLLAHQIAHVVLRHGTQLVTKATPNRGRVSVASAINQFDLRLEPDSVLFQYSPEIEAQADVLATQMLYDARFDPRQMPVFLQALANQNRSADFLKDHPGVGAGIARVRQELQNIGPLPRELRGDSPDLRTAQLALRDEATGRVANNRNRRGDVDSVPRNSRNDIDSSPALPSNRMVTYEGRDLTFRYPENWRLTEEGDAVYIAPSGGMVSGELAYGMRISTFEPRGGLRATNSLAVPQGARTGRITVATATDQLLADLRSANPNMRTVRPGVRRQINGEFGLATELTNDSPIGGIETNWLVTVLQPDGLLYYFIGVAPQREFSQYLPAFERVINSVELYY